MKRPLSPLAFSSLALLAAATFGTAQARSLADVKASGVIRIGTNAEFKPFTYFEGTTMKGFEYDLGNLLAKQLGVKAQWINQPFDSLLIGLNADRFDLVISSHGITPERQKAVDFSIPHYCSGGVILTRTGGPTTAAALKGKKVGMQIGTTYVGQVRKMFGESAVRTYPSNAAAQQALMAGRVDAMVNEKFYNVEALKATKGKLVEGDMLFQEKLAMPVKKGNKTLLTAVNGALATVLKNGEYQKLSKQWFGQDVRCK